LSGKWTGKRRIDIGVVVAIVRLFDNQESLGEIDDVVIDVIPAVPVHLCVRVVTIWRAASNKEHWFLRVKNAIARLVTAKAHVSFEHLAIWADCVGLRRC